MKIDYEKIIGRLSSFFRFMYWLSLLGVLVQLGNMFQQREAGNLNPLAFGLVAAVCYSLYVALNILLDLNERITYMQKIQEQQNKMLSRIYDQLRREDETELS